VSELPYTISAILQQLGSGLSGALCYVGASQLQHRCQPGDHECRPPKRSERRADGGISWDVGLMFKVNGRRGQDWRILISYEPDDTYSVYLSRKAKIKETREGLFRVILDSASDVYCSELQRMIEVMYDKAIKEYNDGFIPI
jgi:hypothetical protein